MLITDVYKCACLPTSTQLNTGVLDLMRGKGCNHVSSNMSIMVNRQRE